MSRRIAAAECFDPEFELVDTGAFAEQRYFDVTIEYAKGGPDDILMRITAKNRGPDTAPLHLLPQLWARNNWSWSGAIERPLLKAVGPATIEAAHPKFGPMQLDIDGAPVLLFCENETNGNRLFGFSGSGPFKDGIDSYVVHGDRGAVGAEGRGTKCAAHFQMELEPGERRTICPAVPLARLRRPAFRRFRPHLRRPHRGGRRILRFAAAGHCGPDARLVQRQALAGMLWSKQFYYFDIPQWLAGDPTQPTPPESRRRGRNAAWLHLNNSDIIAMPDKWEYPWYAAWDLAFHCVTFALIDPEFAKSQLVLMTREWYMHPNGQLPAYEWAFDDVNPPVHAWASWRVYQMDKALKGKGDRAFLEGVFHKLILNFNWWVNRKDMCGRNVFEGGFLGLDNIGLFDRSAPLPTGGYISQSDGTAWMAMYALNLMRIALELAIENHVYEDLATKFFEHFLYIADAMTRMGGEHGLWDEQDEFFYDVLNLPGDRSIPLRVRSMVGLIPLYAVEVLQAEIFEQLPAFTARLRWFLDHRPNLAKLVSRWTQPAQGEVHLLSLLRGHRMKKLLKTRNAPSTRRSSCPTTGFAPCLGCMPGRPMSSNVRT
ncbi:MAG: hypothetical protein WDN69_24400 [Aliidongia sp.]